MNKIVIGIGCDIVKIDRIKLEMIDKILTENEQKLFLNKIGKNKREFLAGRFAAKEAIQKAFSKIRILSMDEIEILYDEKNNLKCYVDDYNIIISISHDGDYAISYCIIQK